MLKKLFFLLPVLFLAANTLLAQDEDLPPPSSSPQPGQQQPASTGTTPDNGKNFQGFGKTKKIDLSKFIIEPDFYFDVGDGEIDLGFSPCVGYKVWKELYLGGAITYLYTGFRDIPTIGPYGGTIYTNANWNTFGGGIFAQYNIWGGFFTRVRFDVLHRIIQEPDGNVNITINPVNNTYQVSIPQVQVTIPDMLVGVGYNLLRSKNFFFPIMVSYNVLSGVTNNTYSIYPHNVVIQLGFVDIF